MTQPIETNLPGRPLMPGAVVAELAQAVSAKGPSYVPRTKHLDAGAPRYTNRLVLEPSPYLLQHAHNPVNWYPWGEEAFAAARRENKPVFLSIGYSTCHWCHVMEEESFEDEEIAAYLNQHYVCIKVDREERPDVDAVYMSAVQNLTGGGGWPMSVWLTADREPFFAGTYFPPRDGVRGVRRGFLTLVRELGETFKKDPAQVRQAAQALVKAVKDDMEGAADAAGSGVPEPKVIAATVGYLKNAFDPVYGGLRRAPKFPSNVPIRLLLRYHRRTGDERALHMALLTLEKMAAGGLYDQVGGGFHRYATDALWLVPHFEKMLYDNALLTVAYLEGFQQSGREDFARVAREVLDYVLGEMTSPEGGFYSATDADSPGPDGRREEGVFFVWSLDELEAVLGPEAEAFAQHYGITRQGNFEGANIPHVLVPNEATWGALAGARQKLYEARRLRPPPLRDEKILAAWNGLMLSAFAVGGRVLDEPRYVHAATRAADFLLRHMRKDGRMVRSYKEGRVQPRGFLEDQAFVAAGLLDLFEATADPRWLEASQGLAQATEEHFADLERGGWFTSAHDGEPLLARERPAYDGAEPSGTSVAIMNALRLYTFASDPAWKTVAEKGLASLQPRLVQSGLGLTEALLALDRHADKPREIVIVWPPGQRHTAQPLIDVVRRAFVPNRALVTAEAGPSLEALARWVPFVSGKEPEGGRATAYVCEEGRCELPVTDPARFAAQLQKVRPY
ncbi:MAG: thioredoxin domain-containing protein [Myxococcales bacterium]|nr:thioredoxin domain-containing protein [Myxococcales bacterium]